MSGLVRAEFRKIFTTKLWWALLIPVAVLSFGAGWFGTVLGTFNGLQQAAGGPLPLGLLTVSMATNFSTIFAALFGALAVSGEHWNRSITTTYLTANPRGLVLCARLIAYTNMGLLYGLVNVVCSSLGALVGDGLVGLGRPLDWFVVSAAGLLVMVLWMLLGVGLGSLIPNSVAAIFVLVLYRFPVESLLGTLLASGGSKATEVMTTYLPAAAAGGVLGNLVVPIFIADVARPGDTAIPREAFDALHAFAGGSFDQSWGLSLLAFTGYTAVIVLLGWVADRRRDIG